MKLNNISIAPMMDYTDTHFRYFMRLITKRVTLYTEMITAQAIVHGNRQKLLGFHPCENPLVLQVGGCDPALMAKSAFFAEQFQYDEININAGCPSERVKSGAFGACLMAEPDTVARCIEAMKKASSLPVTVKTRIGIDHFDDYAFLHRFIKITSNAGCDTFMIHARKAWLSGLSPKENREIPPLRYEVAAQIKNDFPQLNIYLNGGIKTLEDIHHHLSLFDGVMIGREAVNNPFLFSTIDSLFFDEAPSKISRAEIARTYFSYVTEQYHQGHSLSVLLKPMIHLYQGEIGARNWRRKLSALVQQKKISASDIHDILDNLLS